MSFTVAWATKLVISNLTKNFLRMQMARKTEDVWVRVMYGVLSTESGNESVRSFASFVIESFLNRRNLCGLVTTQMPFLENISKMPQLFCVLKFSYAVN